MINFYSGGAEGADCVFGNLALSLGHHVTHFSFKNHKGFMADRKYALELTHDQLKKADSSLIRANQTLGRSFPSQNHGVNCLLRRNYYQVLNTDAVFAACSFENVDSLFASEPKGGTAWAIQMFIDRNFYDATQDVVGLTKLPLFILNTKTNQWYEHNSTYPCTSSKGKLISIYEKMIDPPKILNEDGKNWTGIGTRELTHANEQAIMSLNS